MFLNPSVRIHLLPGGIMPVQKTSGAAGYDVSIRAIVSGTEREPDVPHLRKTLFDFNKHPPMNFPWSRFIKEDQNERGEREWVYELRPGAQVLVGIGFLTEMPPGFYYELRPRSGLITLHGLEVVNASAPIDSDFRGEAGALLRNQGDKSIDLRRGMRVAQIVFHWSISPKFTNIFSSVMLTPTERGSPGFGSTGVM